MILAFIDPVCRNLCPLEAKVLNSVPSQLPASSRPAIVAVSVNPWGQAAANLRGADGINIDYEGVNQLCPDGVRRL